ncbi:MAG: hypothetical protein O7D95_05105 [Betaproteobacteria bacterium]|nr:hypothetical protein [Betaproteobacteria bacterium]
MDNIQQKMESAQIVSGYALPPILIGIASWAQTFTPIMEFIILIFAILIGLTALWLNILKIKKQTKEVSK